MQVLKYLGVSLLISAVFILIIVVVSLAGRTCDTASRMADRTIFNAEKHVWTYEEFRRKYSSFQQYEVQYNAAKQELEKLRAGGRDSNDPEYRNIVMQKSGSYQMMITIVKEYNAMSDIAYQNIWRGHFPSKLEVPAS